MPTVLYPVGNTPAVCLTQSHPPEHDASLLLLGCGDIRNVLCTAYSQPASTSRKLDFTCNDDDIRVLASTIMTGQSLY
ncbi:hypothetical protein BDV96DRAFT_587506 [Lophiotrema nucula]|uniref:DUF4470 domain-containing protein n=1 Tax=Lophiotrema nucula TaxID=690887 RepID=A0A6A5YNF8_9PLEO|nr:hypothetical protein BDV96DRAFT_587506 [Lophiotrema nucula]